MRLDLEKWMYVSVITMEEWGQSSAGSCVEEVNGVTNGAEELQHMSGRWGAGVMGEGGVIK